MRIITKMLSDQVYEATNDNGNSITVDMRRREDKVHLSPMELVLSAIAGCAAVDIVVMLKKRKKTILSFDVETNGDRREEAPKSFTKIHCTYTVTSPDVTEEELQKSASLTLEKYCSVASSVKAPITFDVRVIRP